MSDQLLPDDEVVSAYLDNEATPAESAALEHDDGLKARVETLGAVRDAVAAPVPPVPADLRDRMIDAAMAAAEEAIGAASAEVVPLRRARQTLLAVAAAVMLVAAVAGVGRLAGRLDGGDDTESATSAPSADAADSAPADDGDAEAAEADALMAAEAAEEEPAAEEAMAEMAEMADEATAEAAEAAREAAASAEAAMADQGGLDTAADDSAMAQPTTTALAAPEASAEEPEEEPEEEPAADRDSSAEPDSAPALPMVVDLGLVDDLESFLDILATRTVEPRRAGDAMGGSGPCATAVQDHIDSLEHEPLGNFVVALDAPPLATVDAALIRRDSGAVLVVYAVEPECRLAVHDLNDDATP